jgi:hypothetical protein
MELNQGGKEDAIYNKTKKLNWICNFLRRNCLLRYVIEGKAERKRRRGKRQAAIG